MLQRKTKDLFSVNSKVRIEVLCLQSANIRGKLHVSLFNDGDSSVHCFLAVYNPAGASYHADNDQTKNTTEYNGGNQSSVRWFFDENRWFFDENHFSHSHIRGCGKAITGKVKGELATKRVNFIQGRDSRRSKPETLICELSKF
mmetsp:Transcript_20920/g.31700  ORF Transcript_20920/g.31700 Transcript_20920/m.31700 type:complete len:144 (+) Transcript_20920:15-446(+)